MSSIAEMMSPINSKIAPIIGMSKITIKKPKAIESINPIILILIMKRRVWKEPLTLCVSVIVLRIIFYYGIFGKGIQQTTV